MLDRAGRVVLINYGSPPFAARVRRQRERQPVQTNGSSKVAARCAR
jgi:hypothetical protein